MDRLRGRDGLNGNRRLRTGALLGDELLQLREKCGLVRLWGLRRCLLLRGRLRCGLGGLRRLLLREELLGGGEELGVS